MRNPLFERRLLRFERVAEVVSKRDRTNKYAGKQKSDLRRLDTVVRNFSGRQHARVTRDRRAIPLLPLVNYTALHYKIHIFQLGDVCQRVAVNRDDIGVKTGRDLSHLVLPADQVRRVCGRRLDRL